MIKGNQIIFGYGTIATGRNGALTFEYIQPPAEIGADIDIKNYEVLEKVVFNVNTSLFTLKEYLMNTTEENCLIVYNDYILNFSNFNIGSVNVVLKAVNSLIWDYYQHALAC